MNKISVKPYLAGHTTITKNMEAKRTVLVYKRKHPCVYTTVNNGVISFTKQGIRRK